MRTYKGFVCRSNGTRRSRAIRRPTISHSCSIGDISGEIRRPKEESVPAANLGWDLKVPSDMWTNHLRAAHNRQTSRIDEAHNETRVAVDHSAASCLEKLCGPSEPFASGVCLRELTSHFRGPLTDFRAVRPSSVHCFRNTHDCAAVTLHTSGYCTIRQPASTKADDSALFKHRNFAQISLSFIHEA
ncbi:hypothetical protein TNCV_2535691 [Trichonephila clavipes]|nr:hypothetical protein TNCV_2535691 [Trichonephila clavipes]